MTVGLILSQKGRTVVTVQPHRTLAEAVALLNDKGIGALVVSDAGQSVICTRATAVEEVMELMTEGRFRHVPVVEEDRLIGLVSIGDVVKHRIASVEAEHQAMREYIATA